MLHRVATAGCLVCLILSTWAAGRTDASTLQEGTLTWMTDYRQAMALAKEQQKMVFILFHDGEDTRVAEAFESNSLNATVTDDHLNHYIWLKLPLDAAIEIDGQSQRLLDHAAFAEMRHREGIAVIDLENTEARHYRYVVSQFPFSAGRYYGTEKTTVILDLPPGTLTQRTMIYAVRIHPEGPQSAFGEVSTELLTEAESHSSRQAQMQVQGHHSWESRFHRINAKLPGGLRSQEVVAESWPGETLVEAAVECVHSWRQSSGHWGAVRRRQPLFGFDMKRGRNGIWYATGIFGNRGG